MRENTFLAPKDETPSPVVPPQPLLDSIKSGNVPHLKQVSKKKSFLPAKKSATKSSLPEKALQPQAKPFVSSLAKRQPSEPVAKSRVSLLNKSAPAPSPQVKSLSKKAPVKSAPVKSAPSVMRSCVKKAPAKTQVCPMCCMCSLVPRLTILAPRILIWQVSKLFLVVLSQIVM